MSIDWTVKRLIFLRISCKQGNENFPETGFKKTQFPVRVRFAITTNKGEEQSFSGAINPDLIHECFIHGQLYVSMSSITHPCIPIYVQNGMITLLQMLFTRLYCPRVSNHL